MNQGTVVWITGRPASGKSTFGGYLASLLRADGVPCALLDGDEVRDALGRAAGRGPEERDAFYEALARLAALLARQGLSVIVPATAHRRAYRERARSLAPRFIEVHVATPPDECARRDPKGLYALVREGAAVGLPGADEPFEDPVAPDVIALDGEDERALAHALALLRLARPRARAVRPGPHRGGGPSRENAAALAPRAGARRHASTGCSTRASGPSSDGGRESPRLVGHAR